MVTGQFHGDVDESTGLVLFGYDTTCVFSASLMVTWSLPGVATNSAFAPVCLKMVLKRMNKRVRIMIKLDHT